MPVGQFGTPQPNRLIAAMQQLMNKQPYALNRLYPGSPQHYLGTWLQAQPEDPNLSIVRLQGGTTVLFVAKTTTATFVAGDVVKLEKSSVFPLHITGKFIGDITKAGAAGAGVAAPGAPSSYAAGAKTTTTCPVTWAAGADYFGAGLSYQLYLNGAFKQTTPVGVTSATITGLKAGTTYTSYLKSTDGQGKTSVASSNTITFTTLGTPAPPIGTSVSKTYSATKLYSYNYNGNGERNSFHDGKAYQGNDQTGHGNQYGLIQFPWATMANDTAGHDVTGGVFTVYYAHWYYGSGGYAVIGTHDYTNIPTSTASSAHYIRARWASIHSTVGVKFTWNMGASIADEFRTGDSKGIMIGYGTNSTGSYYGYTYGLGTYVPKIKLTWIA